MSFPQTGVKTFPQVELNRQLTIFYNICNKWKRSEFFIYTTNADFSNRCLKLK